MKQFNNSYNGNVNAGNIHEFQPDYSPKSLQTERIIVVFLILVGIAGTAYFLANFGFSNKNLPIVSSQITKNVIPPDMDNNAQAIPLQGNISGGSADKTQLRIEGDHEASQKMKFTIESFDQKASYDLIMGDGTVLNPRNKTIEYAYKKAGIYRIQLKVNYNGKSEKLFSEKIQILEPIAVAPGAYQEY